MKAPMRMVFFSIFLVACSGAVSRYDWVHPTAPETQILRDRYECERDTRIVAYPPKPLPREEGFVKGFEEGLYKGEVLATQAQAEKLFKMCMQSRGYQWVDVAARERRARVIRAFSECKTPGAELLEVRDNGGYTFKARPGDHDAISKCVERRAW